jgi:hypothetical protein
MVWVRSVGIFHSMTFLRLNRVLFGCKLLNGVRWEVCWCYYHTVVPATHSTRPTSVALEEDLAPVNMTLDWSIASESFLLVGSL